MTTQNLALTAIDESPTNPRKAFGDLTELVESIKTVGILQPILVRPSGTNLRRFECVFGHRRLRAAKAAGLTEVPALVRPLDDRQVLEAQIVENCQRADIHPLEEGAAYRELHEKHGMTVEELAAKVGKSTSTVHARMKLCALADAPRKALLEGKLSPSIALLIARIPHEKLQREVAKKILENPRYRDEPMPYREAERLVHEEYLLQLAGAPFDTKSVVLVHEAGACTTCPKRSGAQPELFPDVKRGDVCTDPLCFGRKRDAAWKLRTAEAKASGQRVLTAAEAKQVWPYGNTWLSGGEWMDLNEKTFIQALSSGESTPKTVAKKAGVELEVVLARDPTGATRELVSRKAVEAAARKLAPKDRAGTAASGPDREAEKKQQDQWRREQELRRATDRKVIGAVVAAVERRPCDEAWTAVLEAVFDVCYDLEAIVERRGLNPDLEPDEALREYFSTATVPQRLGLLVEVAYRGKADDALVKACAVDRKKLEAEAKAELKAKRQAEAAEAKAKAKGGKRPKRMSRELAEDCDARERGDFEPEDAEAEEDG